MAMLHAIIQVAEDPVALARLAQGTSPGGRPELKKALVGRVTPHHRFLLA